MKANVLRAPLINSAIVLVIFSLLVYFTSTSPEGSVWTSIGTLFVVAFTTIQWVFALSIGLLISLAVLFGIFFGAVAMVNPASASRMYDGLCQTLLVWLSPLVTLLKSDREEKLAAALDAFGQELKKEIRVDIQVAQASLKKTQTELETKVGSLTSRLAVLEETTTELAAGEQVDALAGEIKEAVEAVAEIKRTVDALKSSVEQTAQQVQEVSAEAILGELPARIEALEQQETAEAPVAVDIVPLQQDIAEVQAQLASVQQQADEASKMAAQAVADTAKQPAAEPAASEVPESNQDTGITENEEEHRIFSYFDDPADKKTVADVVASTLKKDMSYKQVMDLLAKELGGEKGAIITSHPSLSKDYIRLCRKTG
jgi:uncharacterized protein YoxC